MQSKPDLNHKLKFPPPETLEIKVLTIEFIELWKRLSDLHKKNLKNFHESKGANTPSLLSPKFAQYQQNLTYKKDSHSCSLFL